MDYKKDEEKERVRKQLVEDIRQRYAILKPHLNERTIRLFVAMEAMSIGYKGIQIVSEATGISRVTIIDGCHELQTTDDTTGKERIRKSGAGRKKTAEANPEILEALKKLMETATLGENGEWIYKSQRKLAEELNRAGFKVSHTTVGSMLETLGYKSSRK